MAYLFDIPKINPLRLIPANASQIDFIYTLPRIDLMRQREDYQKGEYAQKQFYVNWKESEPIMLQFGVFAEALPAPQPTITATVINIDTGAVAPLSVTDVTPAGWVGYRQKQITHYPITGGFFQIRIAVNFPTPGDFDPVLISDTFYLEIESESVEEKDFVQIKYKNSYNRLGMVFGADYFHIYFKGMIDEGESETENTVSQEDDGTNLRQSESYGGIKVILAELHRTQIRQLEKICQCDEMLLNEIPVICKYGIEREKSEKSDLYNVTINFTLADNDDFMNYFPVNAIIV